MKKKTLCGSIGEFWLCELYRVCFFDLCFFIRHEEESVFLQALRELVCRVPFWIESTCRDRLCISIKCYRYLL